MSTRTRTPGVAVHALAWLVAGNVLGVLCAALLVWPAEAGMARLLNYGRLMAAHANIQLYGWCMLPFVAMLLVWFRNGSERDKPREGAALAAWSLSLFLGGLGWLQGAAIGKPFMEWTRWEAAGFALALCVLWVALADATEERASDLRVTRRRLSMLVILLPVPFVFFLAADPGIYPSVNPHSGGATGTSLLRSTLGLVLIYGLAPRLLRLRPRSRRRERVFWVAFALACLVALWAAEGNVSNRESSQMLVLCSLLPWPVLLALHVANFGWGGAALGWLRWSLAWGGLLCATGVILFIPGVLDSLKFGQALAAHAHLAMAGVVGAFGWAILHEADPALATRPWLRLSWNLALAAHLGSLCVAAAAEHAAAGALYSSNRYVIAAFVFRLLAGLVMLCVSVAWLAGALRERDASVPQAHV